MTLFAVSALLAALLIASYGTRRIWLACLSIALSAAVVAGAIFVATTETPAEERAKLAFLAEKLSLVFDPQSLDVVTAALDRVTTFVAQYQLVAPSEVPTMQAATTPSWFGADSAPKPARTKI